MTCAKSDLNSLIQARATNINLRNIYRRKVKIEKGYTNYFSAYLLMGEKFEALLGIKAEVYWKF